MTNDVFADSMLAVKDAALFNQSVSLGARPTFDYSIAIVTAVVDLGMCRNAGERSHTSAGPIGHKFLEATQPMKLPSPRAIYM